MKKPKQKNPTNIYLHKAQQKNKKKVEISLPLFWSLCVRCSWGSSFLTRTRLVAGC